MSNYNFLCNIYDGKNKVIKAGTYYRAFTDNELVHNTIIGIAEDYMQVEQEECSFSFDLNFKIIDPLSLSGGGTITGTSIDCITHLVNDFTTLLSGNYDGSSFDIFYDGLFKFGWQYSYIAEYIIEEDQEVSELGYRIWMSLFTTNYPTTYCLPAGTYVGNDSIIINGDDFALRYTDVVDSGDAISGSLLLALFFEGSAIIHTATEGAINNTYSHIVLYPGGTGGTSTFDPGIYYGTSAWFNAVLSNQGPPEGSFITAGTVAATQDEETSTITYTPSWTDEYKTITVGENAVVDYFTLILFNLVYSKIE